MNKKIIALLFLPAFAFAAEELDMEKIGKARDEWAKEHFASQGTAMPDGGIRLMPEQQMSQYNIFKSQRAKERADINKFGYIKQSLPEIQSLLNFKSIAKNKNDGLRHSINEIQMAYVFKGVPSNLISKMLGVAPSVTFVQGQGWAGAMQYFDAQSNGTCSYRENNLKFSHGSAIIPEEDATKEVNGKVTVSNVTGKAGNGFMYSVDWYDNNFFRELKCAKSDYNPETLNSVVEIARQIDNNS